MRVVELSNHPGDMLTDVSRRRETTDKRALARYEDELIQHRAQLQTVRVRRARARAERHWWAWLRLAFAVWSQKRQVPRRPAPGRGSTDQEERLKAGIAGEQLVATELGRALGDDWTLLRGYRNRRGEIDHLLLGPGGLYAIEVKNLNATVHVDGDSWRADKYDNYGNLVEQRPVADRKGRSPSVQLNESADALERFLRQRGQPVTVQRVVILAHRRSRLGTHRNLTVMVGTSTDYVLSLLGDSADRLDDRQRTEVERLIRHDHDLNEQQTRRTGSQTRRTGSPSRRGARPSTRRR
jgi:nuclease-like protein